MPAGDYFSAGTGGALKLKGAKVQKTTKKKRSKSQSKDKDKSASLERSLSSTPGAETQLEERDGIKDAKKAAISGHESEPEPEYKTEAERRHEEAVKKKMQRILEDPALASEIRKTHKERVESLNTYLSKLSEHHDMPKIGPG
ncbi:hypothetical protein F4824DRAFT_465489 [Ustulina deusta]|nr:hypothetical protein F4823DRAFT_587189 [Ustulina deusta]KAI3335007.1 hypothetical protein F4824DRAFT_465489 [Ustulina deusta]